MDKCHSHCFHCTLLCLTLHSDPEDYTTTQRQLTFDPDNLEIEVPVPITNDNIYEPNVEQFTAQLTLLSTGADVDVICPTAIVAITDDDSKQRSKFSGTT